MNEIVTAVLVGAGGYGEFYRRAFATGADANQVQLVGVIDPTVAGGPIEAELRDAQIPLYRDSDSFWAAATAQLVVVAAPIHFHSAYTCDALARGAHVLCEKPLCATLQEAAAMLAAQQRYGGFVAVGYQWSFSPAIGALKADILAGRLGAPRRFKACVLWPRTATYYARNNWAGRLRMPDGRWVLDSPVSNATAHYLHNLFYLLGDRREHSAQPVAVQAELYHANPIENCDTAALRCTTANGVEVLYYASHAILDQGRPTFQLEFEEAVVTYPVDGGEGRPAEIVATLHDGRQKHYGDPFADDASKLWQCADAIRTGTPVACNLAAATAHVRAINGMHESMPMIGHFPTELIKQQNGLTWVSGLQETLLAAHAQNRLPSELGNVPWAQPGHIIDMTTCSTFPQNPMFL